jgi:drug/metabolite transporter (DMT)-like permease
MPPANLLGILFALTSAAVWGSGDFCDGLAARRHHSFQVLVFSSLSGLVMMVFLAVLIQETFPGFPNLLWACVAGISGALGLAALYRGLAIGCAAIVAPTSAVVGAILPVVYGLLTNGLPSLTHLAGFCLAFLGIWLVSRSAAGADAGARRGFLLACLAGVGFGGFFILVMLGIALVLLSTNHLTLPGWRETPEAWLAGVLDAGGNVFYLLAKQYTRLDVAAVLSSLYPAATVILAALLLKERISRGQWLGAGICLLAIILITI